MLMSFVFFVQNLYPHDAS